MARNDLRITIDADAARAEREIKRAEAAVRALDREIAKASKTADAFDKALGEERARALKMLGTAMVGFGAATLAGLGLATKAAIDWESAWTGVRKTVEGSPEELAAVEAGLRDLATTLPATHGEIAAVAEAAGQLGVATGDVVAFTKVMVDLGETTNLTAEEAATSIAQLMNIMQTAPDQVDELGSALVALGNNGASTERDIIQMAQRIAGAGKVVGASEADVLGLANALASLGIEVEAGGSAISRVIIDIGKAVATGNDDLEGFARVAGMSADRFATAFREDPALAVASFVEGLGAINAAGGDVFTILDDLGQADIRVSRALLSMAGSGDLLRRSIELGRDAWAENTALVEEAEKRYDTAAAKIQIAQGALVDLAIDIGNVVLPMVAGLAETGADVLSFLGDLPGPVKTAATILAGLAGVVSLVGGGFFLLGPRIVAAHQAMQLLATSAPRAAAGLRAVSAAAGIVGVLGAVATAIFAIGTASKKSGPPVGEMTKALLDLEAAADTAAFREFLGITDKAVLSALKWGFLGDTVEEVSQKMALSSENLESVDSALTGLVTGGQTEKAAELLASFAEFAGLTDKQLGELAERGLPQYTAALADVDVAQQLVNDAMTDLDRELETVAAQFGLTGDDAAEAAQKMLSEWSDASSEFVSLVGAYTDVLAEKEEMERETAEATADATSDSSDSWEDYVRDVDVTLQEYLDQLAGMVQAQEDWAVNMAQLATRVPPAILDELARLGPEGAPLVADLVDATDEEMDRFVELFDRQSELASEAMLLNLVESEPDLKRVAAVNGRTVAMTIAEEMIRNGGTVFDAASRLGRDIDTGVGLKKPRVVVIAPGIAGRALRIAKGQLDDLARKRIAQLDIRVAGVTGVGGVTVGLDRQTGGKVPGAPSQPVDITAHGSEWVINPRASAFYGDEMLRAINEMRWSPVGPVTATGPSRATSGGEFVGDLYLDSGQFLGTVRGEIRSEMSTHDRNLRRRAMSGSGAR